jgi:hypothetical protein
VAVSTPKTKIVALQGESPTRAKFMLNGKAIGQVSMFKYLDYLQILILLMSLT